MKIVDLTYLLNNNTKQYPGDKELKINKINFLNNDGYNLYEINTNMHIGTHIEGKLHFFEDKKYIGNYDLNNFFGSAKIINVKNLDIIYWKEEYDKLINNNDVLILYSGFKLNDKNYFSNHPIIDEQMAKKLVSKKIKMLVLDFASPDYYPYNIHKILLENNIFIVENVTNLEEILEEKDITFYAIPLKIEAEASLIRAFALIK